VGFVYNQSFDGQFGQKFFPQRVFYALGRDKKQIELPLLSLF